MHFPAIRNPINIPYTGELSTCAMDKHGKPNIGIFKASQAVDNFGNDCQISTLAKSVGCVEVRSSQGTFRGSAFLVGKDKQGAYFITNKHVVDKSKDGKGIGVQIGLPTNSFETDQLTPIGVSQVIRCSNCDVSCICVRDNEVEKIQVEPLKLAEDGLNYGDQCFGFGYKNGTEFLISSGAVKYPPFDSTFGFPSSNEVFETQTKDLPLLKYIGQTWSRSWQLGMRAQSVFNKNRDERYFLKQKIFEGMSGGPVLNTDGEVIGVNTSSLSPRFNLTKKVVPDRSYPLGGEILKEFLTAANVPFTIAKQK